MGSNSLASMAIESKNNTNILQKQKRKYIVHQSFNLHPLQNDSYLLLGPGDVLKLYFLGDEKLTEVQILSDGTATIPFFRKYKFALDDHKSSKA